MDGPVLFRRGGRTRIRRSGEEARIEHRPSRGRDLDHIPASRALRLWGRSP